MAADTNKTVDLSDGTVVWDELSRRLDALAAAWRAASGEPPRLAEYVPVEPPGLRSLALVELVKYDLEQRWHARRAPKRIDEYLAEFPELATDGRLPCDLVYEEYHIRKLAGDDPTPDEYFQRFPRQADELRRLLQLERSNLTTTLRRAAPPEELAAGQQIDDFDLLSELGRGAFAAVYLARQRSMQRMVALKVSSDKGSEPQTLAQLDHPHIVRVYDQRLLPARRLRLLYMQYVAGGTLQTVVEHTARVPSAAKSGKTMLEAIDRALARRGEYAPEGLPLRQKLEHATWPEVVCWLGARLASALAYAHAQGILHRDVKPANVLVGSDGSPKLADFNISFASKLSGATPAAYFGGSLAYMSPEQLEACNPAHPRDPAELDGRADVYSLGVVLWELLTGRRPFADEPAEGRWTSTLEKLAAERRAGVPAEARSTVPPGYPPALVQTLLACLAPDAATRCSSAAELGRQLELCLQPRAQRLLAAPSGWWRRLAAAHPLVAAIAAGFAPNIVMSGLNIAYNFYEIIRHLEPEVQQVFFDRQILTVNAVAYVVGLAWVYWLIRPVLRAVKRTGAAATSRVDVADSWGPPALRSRALRLGEYVAGVSAIEWAVSGVVFPVWMTAHAGPAGLAWSNYVHFEVSQVLCGLMAATATYFLMTILGVRFFYPRLVAAAPPMPDEVQPLAALARRVWLVFGLAVLVPFLAVMVTVMVDTGRVAIGALGGIGFVLSLAALRWTLMIRTDLDALALVVNPAGQSLAGTDTTVDSFWTRTR